MVLAELGADEQRARWLPGAATGELLLTAAVAEERTHLPPVPRSPRVPDGDWWLLTGSKSIVRAGTIAQLFLTTASTDGGTGVFLLEPGADGAVTRRAAHQRRGPRRPARPHRRSAELLGAGDGSVRADGRPPHGSQSS